MQFSPYLISEECQISKNMLFLCKIFLMFEIFLPENKIVVKATPPPRHMWRLRPLSFCVEAAPFPLLRLSLTNTSVTRVNQNEGIYEIAIQHKCYI